MSNREGASSLARSMNPRLGFFDWPNVPFHDCQRGTVVPYEDGDASLRSVSPCSRNDTISNAIVTFAAVGIFAAVLRPQGFPARSPLLLRCSALRSARHLKKNNNKYL
jgi:hypothetical protein